MGKNYKMTTFSKFLIFLIFAAPLSYIGASYYNGQNPFEKFKEISIFENSKSESTTTKVITNENSNNNVGEESFNKEIELKELEIKQLNKRIEKLEEIIETQKKEIENLKVQ
ncbi:MAG: hypothetical protein R2771_04900 [Saprospiraceae bacterium]